MSSPSTTYRRIYAAVSRIPRGRVATYGQIAEAAGLPRQARLVGYALSALPPDTNVPWHRVVNAEGRISRRSGDLGSEEMQARMLRREGVGFVNGVVLLARHRWRPRAPARPRDAYRISRNGRRPRNRTVANQV